MTELVHTENALVEKKEWATTVAAANMVPRQFQKNPANLFVAAEYADELGIGRMNALTDIYVIEGKPSLSSYLMAALVRCAGHKLRVQVGEGPAARAVLIRKDDPEFEFVSVWTMERAKAAGLTNKAVWKSYPEAMLKARAISEVVREGASEVLAGALYVPEELGAEVNPDGRPETPEVHTEAVTIDDLLDPDEAYAQEVQG